MTDLISHVFPLGKYFDDDGLRSLGEVLYHAPFCWYRNLGGVDPNDYEAVQRWHIEPMLKHLNDKELCEARTGEFAITRLPIGVPLATVVPQLEEVAKKLRELGDWGFATMRDAALFAETNLGLILGEGMTRPCRHAWILGSPLRMPSEDGTMRVPLSRFFRASVPAVMFPFMDWVKDRSQDRQLRAGWDISFHHTLWARSEHTEQGGGAPILLVR